MEMDLNNYALENLNFIYEDYNFTICATALKKITYKVYPILTRPQPDKFYNDIMKNEKFDALIGLKTGFIVYGKSGYINIDIDNNVYYMMLELNVIDYTVFHETLFRGVSSESIYREFFPKQFGNIELPVSTEIIRLYLGNNIFQNKYYVVSTISNVDLPHMGWILNNIYETMMLNIDLRVNKLLNETELLTVGFERQYIALTAHQSITLLGYLTPRYINGVKILRLTENSFTIEDSLKWRGDGTLKDSFNIGDIVPYLLNSEHVLFTHRQLLYADPKMINGEQYFDIKFNTEVLVLEDNKSMLVELPSLDADIYRYHMIEESSMFKIYKSNLRKTPYKYCGMALHSKNYSEMLKYIQKITKTEKNYKFEIFYANATKIYFTITSTFNFKSIYDFIVHNIQSILKFKKEKKDV